MTKIALILSALILSSAPALRAADAPAQPAAGTTGGFQTAQKMLQPDSANDREAAAKMALAKIVSEVQQLTNAVIIANKKAAALPPMGDDAASITAHITVEEAVAKAAGQVSAYVKAWESHLADSVKEYQVPASDGMIAGFRKSFGADAPQLLDLYDAMQKYYATDATCLRLLVANIGHWKGEPGKRVFDTPDLQQQYDAALKTAVAAMQAFKQLQAKVLAAEKAAAPVSTM